MNLRAKITVAAGALLLAGCREMPRYFSGDETVARAGGRELRMRDVRKVIPQGLTGGDSAAYVKMYVDRWVRKQLKLQEAEILFSESAGDIDRMVEEYRQALLIRKLDQHYVDRSVDTVFTDDEIVALLQRPQGRFQARPADRQGAHRAVGAALPAGREAQVAHGLRIGGAAAGFQRPLREERFCGQ